MKHASGTRAEDNLSILNLERKILPGPEYLQDLICRSSTSKDAIEFWTTSGDIQKLTYKKLDLLTSRLAVDIVTALKGTTNEAENVIIPVLIPQSLELYISWIAVLKAGFAFCPVAAETPFERLKFILGDVSASLILTTTPYEDRLAKTSGQVQILSVSQYRLEEIQYSFPAADEADMGPRSSRSIAYIMYTSGILLHALLL